MFMTKKKIVGGKNYENMENTNNNNNNIPTNRNS